jgi:hypothetical protein
MPLTAGVILGSGPKFLTWLKNLDWDKNRFMTLPRACTIKQYEFVIFCKFKSTLAYCRICNVFIVLDPQDINNSTNFFTRLKNLIWDEHGSLFCQSIVDKETRFMLLTPGVILGSSPKFFTWLKKLDWDKNRFMTLPRACTIKQYEFVIYCKFKNTLAYCRICNVFIVLDPQDIVWLF